MRTLSWLYLVFLSLLATACTEVELCDKEHPHAGPVTFGYEWGEHAHKPATMGVLVYRVVGQNKRLVKVNTDDNKVNGRDSLSVAVGDYKFVTFPYAADEFDYSEVQQFIDTISADYPLQQVCFSYKEYEKYDPSLRNQPTGWDGKALSSWDDYNGYGGLYIQPDVDILYYDTTQIVRVDDDRVTPVRFTPKSMSQSIDFYFDIQKIVAEQPFVIDHVWAQVSGVPRRMNLNNGHMDISKTNKIMFPISLSKDDGTGVDAETNPDTPDNTVLHCKGNVNVPGIVNVQQRYGETLDEVRKKTNGPGILQVIIYGHANQASGSVKRRRWQGIINLYEALSKAHLITITPDGRYAVRGAEHGEVRIEAKLIMDGNSILRDVTGGDAVEEWIPTVSISLDI